MEKSKSSKDLKDKINLAFGKGLNKQEYGVVGDPIKTLQLKYVNDEITLEELNNKLSVLQKTNELFA